MVEPFTAEQVEFFRDETFGLPRWKSTMCGCTVTWSLGRFRVKPCDYEHVIWCWRIGVPEAIKRKKLREAAIPPDSYHAVLKNYLQWGRGCEIGFGNVLGSYGHGKAAREWTIGEWLQGIEWGLFRREEFLYAAGCTLEQFRSIFGREPNEEVLCECQESAAG